MTKFGDIRLQALKNWYEGDDSEEKCGLRAPPRSFQRPQVSRACLKGEEQPAHNTIPREVYCNRIAEIISQKQGLMMQALREKKESPRLLKIDRAPTANAKQKPRDRSVKSERARYRKIDKS